MYPILFKIGGFTFYTHGLLAVIGIIVGSVLLYFLALRKKLTVTYLFDNMVYAVLFGIIGARLTYFILYFNQFANLREFFYLWDGGMVSYGGFVLGFLAYVLILKSQKQPILPWLDITAIAFALGLVFGRAGNFFAGEYAGVATTSRFSLGGLVPVNIYEGVLVALVFAISLFLFTKYKNLKEGLIFYLFLILYGLGRFIIDFWRDESALFLHISLGQLFSLIIFLIGLLMAISVVMKGKK